MQLDECFRKRLLEKTRPQPGLGTKDLRQAGFFLTEATELLDLGKDAIAILALYNAYFHCARALLFRDGVSERSHHCLARYLQDRYVRTGRLDTRYLGAFEAAMELRHTVQYSTDPVEVEADLAELIAFCDGFIRVVGRICAHDG
ncbi:HEPN domain-containing protein [Candidatus Woesearchaeota archaeon]|nr:HEPN domain-containing protein [Candidatus Woesearchaeota archaeon]